MSNILACSSHSHFCVNDYIAKTKIACDFFSCLYGVRLQVIQPFLFEITVIVFTYKVPLNTSLMSRDM